MKKACLIGGVVICLSSGVIAAGRLQAADEEEEGWISLFDGRSLAGWKASESSSSAWIRCT